MAINSTSHFGVLSTLATRAILVLAGRPKNKTKQNEQQQKLEQQFPLSCYHHSHSLAREEAKSFRTGRRRQKKKTKTKHRSKGMEEISRVRKPARHTEPRLYLGSVAPDLLRHPPTLASRNPLVSEFESHTPSAGNPSPESDAEPCNKARCQASSQLSLCTQKLVPPLHRDSSRPSPANQVHDNCISQSSSQRRCKYLVAQRLAAFRGQTVQRLGKLRSGSKAVERVWVLRKKDEPTGVVTKGALQRQNGVVSGCENQVPSRVHLTNDVRATVSARKRYADGAVEPELLNCDHASTSNVLAHLHPIERKPCALSSHVALLSATLSNLPLALPPSYPNLCASGRANDHSPAETPTTSAHAPHTGASQPASRPDGIHLHVP